MALGWAYINCSSSAGGGSGGGQATGPTGSVQFLTGSNATSGSAKLRYHTASYRGYTPSTLILSGNLVVTGAVSASVFHYRDVTRIDATGSTSFGDTNDDTHIRVGSLIVNKQGVADHVLSASVTRESVYVRGLNVLYEYIPPTSSTLAIYTASAPSYIVGVRSTGSVHLQIPSASIYQSGAILLIKDEGGHINGTNIRLTTSAGDGYTIDGSDNYTLTGSNPAISLYSNGANWFVF